MNIFKTTIVIALLFPLVASSQSVEVPGKNEFGFDAITLLRTGSTFNFIYKRHNISKHYAWRYKMNGSVTTNYTHPSISNLVTNRPPDDLIVKKNSAVSVMAAIGIEKSFSLKGKLQVYHFADLAFSGSNNTNYTINGFSTSTSIITNFIVSRGHYESSDMLLYYGLGARYFLGKHFSLFLETSFSGTLSLSQYKTENNLYSWDNSSGTFRSISYSSSGYDGTWTKGINFNPSAFLYLSYYW